LIQYVPYVYLPFCPVEKHEPLKKWFYIRYKAYINATIKTWGSWVLIVTHLMIPGKLVFYGDAADMGEVAQSIVMANHQTFPDCKWL
jgi:hypothetical protein